MSPRASRSIVVLGMMSKMPVPGVIWQTVHYLVGLRRLGYDVTYVEAHARTPSMFVKGTSDAGSKRAAHWVRDVLADFDAADRWAFHALHHDGACYGMDWADLKDVYRSAALLLNLCGGTRPLEEHVATGRLVLIVTDPVQIEVELFRERPETRALVDAHAAAFTFGENLGRPGCEVPLVPDYAPFPTRQPVVLDFWEHAVPDGGAYTTVANWHQSFRPVRFRGELYHWSKDLEFRKFLDLPARSARPLELALASFQEEDRALLEAKGWGVREAGDFGFDARAYRAYIQGSRGEFTVAKDQNVRLRSGWFSDRSATYLASGRPVVTQDTGFGAVLPTGAGLFGVLDVEGAAAALATIEQDYTAASRAALDVARSCFDYRVVLPRMLADVGLEGPRRRLTVPTVEESSDGPGTESCGGAIPQELVLEPLSRRPLRLPPETLRTLLARPIPVPVRTPAAVPPYQAATVSIVVVTHGKLHLTRLCLESVLANTRHPAWEVIVVDNASTDGTAEYLTKLALCHPTVRLMLNPYNEGFSAACNQGARAACGDLLVFLNNDTVVPPGWLGDLAAALEDPGVGAVNPATNRSGTAADVVGDGPRTYGAFLERAKERGRVHAGSLRSMDMLAFFCLALRRDTWLEIGELDEGYGTGLFEDDDYSARLVEAGYRLCCADGVFVYHFGEGTFGDLVPDGSYGRLYERNRSRFEGRWGAQRPRGDRGGPEYDELVRRVCAEADGLVPAPARVVVVSRGDDRLLGFESAEGWHFPRDDDGTYAGHYPADGPEAVHLLQRAQQQGASHFLIPRPGFWWLDHYPELERHLGYAGELVTRTDDLVLYRLGAPEQATGGAGASPRPRASGASGKASEGSGDGRPDGSPSGRRSGPDGPPRPVFIIGSPRSGTSILTWVLGQHPNLYPLEETAWFGPLHDGAVEAFRIGSSRGELSQLSAMDIGREEFHETLGEALDALIRRHQEWPSGPVAPTQAFARARAPEEPKERWVDGTPQNSFHVEGIAEMFPHAKFIHLLREPHLVVRSLQRFHNIGGRRHTADEGYRKWMAHVRASLAAERALGPDRIVRVLHRDLAATPEEVVRTCLDFVGERYVAECLLPLGQRINSSGDMPLPEGEDQDEPSPEVLAEARALADELFAGVEAGA